MGEMIENVGKYREREGGWILLLLALSETINNQLIRKAIWICVRRINHKRKNKIRKKDIDDTMFLEPFEKKKNV